MVTRVKICCIADIDEARLAVAAGAHALGLVSAMPSGPGPISEDRIAVITAGLPPALGSFLLTSQTEPEAIIAQQRRCGANTLQLVDRVEAGAYETLRRALPGISIVQVIHVMDETAVEEARRVAAHVHAILLDSGNPNLARKELGGTGRTHNWAISSRIVESVSVPVFLAGGLNPGNVGAAIQAVRPFAVDVCSGLRTGDRLDPSKLAAFMAAVSAADRE